MYQITLSIDGMACSMCESHVCDTIRSKFSVKKVTASHSKGEAVILSETQISGSRAESRARPHGLPSAPLQLRAV